MKKAIAFLLAFAMVLSLTLLCPIRSSFAEGTPADEADPVQEISDAFTKLYNSSSYHYDLDLTLKIGIGLSMSGQKMSVPMDILLKFAMDQQMDPLLMQGQLDLKMTTMGQSQKQNAQFFAEKSGSMITSYISTDNGVTWQASRADNIQINPADTVGMVITNTKDIQKTGTEMINDREAAVYVGKLDGQYIQELMAVLNTSSAGSSLNTVFGADTDLNNLGDIGITVYIDTESKLPVRFTMDMTDVLKDIMGTALQSLMNMEGLEDMEIDVSITNAVGDCYLSQFDSIPPIEIPEKAKAAAADLPAPNPELAMGTGSEMGIYYSYGTVLANLFADTNPELLNVKAVSSGGSVVNLRGLASGEYALAIVQSDIMAYGYKGIRLFTEADAMPNVRILAALYAEPIQIVTTDPNIKTVADLRGKKVSIGDSGSIVNQYAMDVLTAYGLDPKMDIEPYYASFGASGEGLKTGVIDASFVCASAPTNAVAALNADKPIYLVSIDDEHFDKIVADCPFYAKYIIGKDVYNTPEDYQTITIKAVLAADASLSDEVAYALVSALFENADKIAAAHAKGTELDLVFASEYVGVPFHPGAAKYYAEKGIEVKVDE